MSVHRERAWRCLTTHGPHWTPSTTTTPTCVTTFTLPNLTHTHMQRGSHMARKLTRCRAWVSMGNAAPCIATLHHLRHPHPHPHMVLHGMALVAVTSHRRCTTWHHPHQYSCSRVCSRVSSRRCRTYTCARSGQACHDPVELEGQAQGKKEVPRSCCRHMCLRRSFKLPCSWWQRMHEVLAPFNHSSNHSPPPWYHRHGLLLLVVVAPIMGTWRLVVNIELLDGTRWSFLICLAPSVCLPRPTPAWFSTFNSWSVKSNSNSNSNGNSNSSRHGSKHRSNSTTRSTINRSHRHSSHRGSSNRPNNNL